MTQKEWTSVGIKLLGLYLLVTYGAGFVAQAVALIANIRNESGVMWRGLVVWQGPINSVLVVAAAIMLLKRTEKICALIWRE